jgi:hypothetical protein
MKIISWEIAFWDLKSLKMSLFTSLIQLISHIWKYNLDFFLSFFFFCCYLGIELRASHLQSRHSTPWATPLLEPLHQPFFVLGIFEIESHRLFAQGWPWTEIFLIPASWAAKVISKSPWCLGSFRLLKALLQCILNWRAVNEILKSFSSWSFI